MLYKNLYAVALIIALVIVGIYLYSHNDATYADNTVVFGEINTKTIILYGASTILILLSIVLTIRFENYFKNKELEEQLFKCNLLRDELIFFNNELPQKLFKSYFFKRVTEYCDEAWAKGEVKNYLVATQLFTDILNYAYHMKDANKVVSWEDESQCMNKMIALLRNCCHLKQTQIDLFELSANYRFPIGLFVIPLFNTVENLFISNKSFLKVECFNIGGYWNCIIGSEHETTGVTIEDDIKDIAICTLQKRLDIGNWPIELRLKKNTPGIEISISGKYAI